MQKINSEQLVNGLMKYLNAEIIPHVSDTFTKLLLKTLVISSQANAPAYTKTVDNMVSGPFISELMKVENGLLDVEGFIDALRQAVNEVGELVVKIPPVKLISPEEKTLRFNAEDISKLKQYLTDETSEVPA